MAVNNKIKAGCLFVVIVWALYSTRDVYKKGTQWARDRPGWMEEPYEMRHARGGRTVDQPIWLDPTFSPPSQEFLAGGGGGYTSGYESR